MEMFIAERMKNQIPLFHTPLFSTIIRTSFNSYQTVGKDRQGQTVTGGGERLREWGPHLMQMVGNRPSEFIAPQCSAQRASPTKKYFIPRGGKSTGLLVRLPLRAHMQVPCGPGWSGQQDRGPRGCDSSPITPRFSSQGHLSGFEATCV